MQAIIRLNDKEYKKNKERAAKHNKTVGLTESVHLSVKGKRCYINLCI
jgi:hypothetical protein